LWRKMGKFVPRTRAEDHAGQVLLNRHKISDLADMAQQKARHKAGLFGVRGF